MAYASGDDFVLRYDARTIADQLSDDNTVVANADVPTHAVVTQLLEDASGKIDGALLASERYSTVDLQNLDGNALSFLQRLCCDVAFAMLFRRRGDCDPDKAQAYAKLAERDLEALRKGQIIFALTSQEQAGLPDSPQFLQTDAQTSWLLRDRVKNYFPARRFPPIRK